MSPVLALFVGSRGAGKSAMTRALRTKYNKEGEPPTFVGFDRDIVREEVCAPGTPYKELSPEEKEEIYKRLYGYAEDILRKRNDVYVTIEGNHRFDWDVFQRFIERLYTRVKIVIVFCYCGKTELQYQRLVNRNAAKDEALIKDKKAFLQHHQDKLQEYLGGTALLCAKFPRIQTITVDTKNILLDLGENKDWARYLTPELVRIYEPFRTRFSPTPFLYSPAHLATTTHSLASSRQNSATSLTALISRREGMSSPNLLAYEAAMRIGTMSVQGTPRCATEAVEAKRVRRRESDVSAPSPTFQS